MYVTQVYCQNPDCNVREVEIRTKDYDQPDPETWYCPACQERATIHWRRTAEEHEAKEDRDAISRVNMQLYARDQGADFLGCPASVMMFEELPDDWKSKS